MVRTLSCFGIIDDVEPFYRTLDADRFLATASTRGPWSNEHQHAGPPSALLVRAAERLAPDMRLARITCEMLRPIPIATVIVDAQVEKAGRKVQIVRAKIVVDDVVTIDARLVMVREIETPTLRVESAPKLPSMSAPFSFDFFKSDVGYHTAIEPRVASGAFGSGAMACWMRMRVPLVDDEEPSGAQRALVAADAGSGVSAGLDFKRVTFANSDLTVHLERKPRGEWILLDASTSSSGNGAALASTRLFDEHGAIGHGLQTLLVEPIAR